MATTLMQRKADFISELKTNTGLRSSWIGMSMEQRFQYIKARFPEFCHHDAVQVYLYKDIKPTGDPTGDAAALDAEIAKAEDGEPTAFWG